MDHDPNKEPTAPEEEEVSTSLDLKEQLEEATSDLERFKSGMQRAQADLLNYKRRTEEERENLLKYSNSRLLVVLLPVLDEFNLALSQSPDENAPESWIEGIRLIQRKLHSLVESEGVTRIEAEGKSFDPLEHEALAQQESTEHEDGQVLIVVRDGYKLRGRLLRPAQVIVSQKMKSNPVISNENNKSSKDGED